MKYRLLFISLPSIHAAMLYIFHLFLPDEKFTKRVLRIFFFFIALVPLRALYDNFVHANGSLLPYMK